jgi:hypothetical protein
LPYIFSLSGDDRIDPVIQPVKPESPGTLKRKATEDSGLSRFPALGLSGVVGGQLQIKTVETFYNKSPDKQPTERIYPKTFSGRFRRCSGKKKPRSAGLF